MKSLVMIFLTVAGFTAHAECPFVEAQLLAQVQEVRSEDADTCTVTLNFSSPRAQLNPSYSCPLEVGDIGNGITIFKNQGLCPVKANDFVSGVLYKSTTDADSRVFLTVF